MNIREAIQDRLDKLQRSHYWLAEQVHQSGVANRQTILKFLAGRQDTTTLRLGVILDILDIELRTRGGR